MRYWTPLNKCQKRVIYVRFEARGRQTAVVLLSTGCLTPVCVAVHLAGNRYYVSPLAACRGCEVPWRVKPCDRACPVIMGVIICACRVNTSRVERDYKPVPLPLALYVMLVNTITPFRYISN